MPSRWNLPVTVAFMAICVVVPFYLLSQMGFLEAPGSHPYTLGITFADAAGLLPNDEVWENGVEVGRVESIASVDGQAHVTVTIIDRAALPIHPDAVAEVRFKNLLGETYVDVVRGSGSARLPSGAEIPISHTITPVQIDQVLSILDPTTIHRLQLLIDAAGGGLASNGNNINAESVSLNTLVTELNGPSTVLGARQQQLQTIVVELERLYTTLAAQRQQVLGEFRTWNQVMGQLAAQEGAIGGTVQEADTFFTTLDSVIGNQGGSLRAALDELPSALASTQSFLGNTNRILEAVATVRQDVHDIFPHLASSFADTTSTGQHLWSVYSVNCPTTCSSGQSELSSGATGSSEVDSYATLWSVEGWG